ncbi:alpha/beta hydrolase [Streptomyces sp. P01-B04]|uniref:alpha/beta fold hydrolase n=1 Tax=Streptomyces poriferorum TaxID=2798799 RepID=UPI001C5E2878|nr:alpha/beta hydrolase [Streptomyces poriferorum]MBW5247727.1 alpha/beta hydrolase [Streptomyces poriferorum]MBW5256390.1 alpha/beta hydrolase [Streptomyces poriferorum]
MPTFHTYDGTELAYRVMGEGEPLICLPGGAMRAGAYLGDLGGLSAVRQLVVLDLRGTGDSAVPDDISTYRCDRLVEDVEALRRHLGTDRADLLAHSAAGDLAALYVARYPQAVRSLILVAPTTRAVGFPFVEREAREAAALRSPEPWYASALPALEEIWAGRMTDELRAAARPFLYGRWDAAAQSHAASSAQQINSEAARAYYGQGAFDPAATVAALRTLAPPVLVLAGEYDGVTTPDRAAELAALFPESEFAVQRGAGHFPWLDDPGAFVRTVTAFLDPDVHSVQAGGIRLAHRMWGDPSAPPVVLVHGRCGSSATWTIVAERLAVRHRVYAFDFRGHGLSDWPGRYSFELFRDDLHAFLEVRNLAGATVVGHSMGGAAAYLLAERQPGLIGRLVIEEAPPPFPLDPPRAAAERPGEELDFDWSLVPSTDAQLNDPDPAGRELLGEITAPTLVIGGGPRSQIDQDDIARMARSIPGARHVTIDAGHLVHTERPEEFLAALRSFGVG